jgi:hypothetical protein
MSDICDGCSFSHYEKETDAQVCTRNGVCVKSNGFGNNSTED